MAAKKANNKSTEETRFLIDQMRKDKMTYALEVMAMSSLSLLLWIGLPSLISQYMLDPLTGAPTKVGIIILQVIVFVPLIYFFYAIFKMVDLKKKISRLEK